MSVERSFEAWEEVQRHGLDLADRLTQGFTGLIQSHMAPPSFSWPNPQKTYLFDVEFPAQNFVRRDFGLAIDSNSGVNGVSAIFDIGNRLGQAGADFGASFKTKLFDVEFPPQNFVKRDFGLAIDSNSGVNGVPAIFDFGNRLGQAGAHFGACLNGVVQQVFRRLPLPFQHEEDAVTLRADMDAQRTDMNAQRSDGSAEEEISAFNLKTAGYFGRPQGTLNVTSTYDSRTHNVESSFVGRGDLWRVEASRGSSTSGNENSSIVVVQLGPVLFFRDSTIHLPVHLSKQHLLWYGYDRKNGMHSLCPAVWSKHRTWFWMSIIGLNPLACSFVDLQFPNCQLTYVSGEGLSTNACLPLFGGLLQAQCQYPGEMKFSFSCKNKWGTRITPTVQWPDKSFTMGLEQALAWKRSGLMVRPTVQFSLCPTIGGSNPGLRAELIHSLKEDLSLICGCALGTIPSAFASISLGSKSKWNGKVGSSGMVVRVETPLGNVGRPTFSVQLKSGIEFYEMGN